MNLMNEFHCNPLLVALFYIAPEATIAIGDGEGKGEESSNNYPGKRQGILIHVTTGSG